MINHGELAISMLDDIDQEGKNLTDWEIEFVDNMLKRVEDGAEITDIMYEKIVQIYEKRVS